MGLPKARKENHAAAIFQAMQPMLQEDVMTSEEFNASLKALDLSQRAFAREIEYHYNQVGRWATGHYAIPKIVAEYLRMRKLLLP